mgnify:FL=1
MPYFWYRCTNDDKHKAHLEISANITAPSNPVCKLCDADFKIVTIKKTGKPREYKTTTNLDLNGLIYNRVKRGTVSEDGPPSAKRQRLDSVSESESDEEEFFDNNEEYVPGSRWNPSWRLTKGSYTSRDKPEVLKACHMQLSKVSRLNITGSKDRGGGQKKQFNGKSAEEVSGRGLAAPILVKKSSEAGDSSSEEWCHLIAASLGGETISKNLVAASYACNTYMATIESFLSARTDLTVEVTAYCEKQDVGEWIEYKIFKRTGSKILVVYQIDARAASFSKLDKDAVDKELKLKAK